MTPSEKQTPTPAHATLLLVLGLLSALGPLATDMYLSSFGLLADYFQTDAGSVSLSLSFYFFGLAAGQLLYGPLMDHWGRKPPLMIGLSVFLCSSLLLAIAPSISFFIGCRLLQAIGSCAGMVVVRAVIGDLYDEKEAARFFSLMMVVTVIAPILAPTLGGYLTLLGWQAIFLFLSFFGLLCLIQTWRLLPETLAPDKRKTASLLKVLRTYRGLLWHRAFILPTLICAISYGELFAFISGSPFVYMTLHHVEPQHYGLLFGINALGMIAAAKTNHALLKHLSPSIILQGSVILNVLCTTALLTFGDTASLPVLIGLILLALIAVPAIGANAMALAISSTAERGSASALIGVGQFGIASLASAGVSALHNNSTYPMTGVIFTCALLSGCLLVLKKGLEKQPA